MNALREVTGTYGGSKTPSNILVYENRDGSRWYVAEGSVNVNCTFDEISEGVDIETLSDIDTMTLNVPAETLADLEHAVDFE